MPKDRPYYILDVFTQQAFGGNPLAVVPDADDLDATAMQAIARQFNLSETVFVCAPKSDLHLGSLRIFTPLAELPFAGHPTIGAAALLARLRAPEFIGARDVGLTLDLAIGAVSCTVRLERRGVDYAYFELPRLPAFVCDADSQALAAALNLAPADIGFGAHRAGVYSAGTPFCFAPVASRAALARAKANPDALQAALCGGVGVFLYTRETDNPEHAVRARMFAPGLGIAEDPATGSAAAAFAAVAVAFEEPEEGEHVLVIEQGYEMGRPSQIVLGATVEAGALSHVTIGGHVRRFAEGRFSL